MTTITDRTVVGPIVHEHDLTFEADEALTKFDLVYVSAAGKVSKTTGGTSAAIGIVDRAYADGAKEVSVLALNMPRTLLMRSSAAINVGVYVMPAADGEIATWAATTDDANAADPTKIGVALTAATAADQYVEVLCA